MKIGFVGFVLLVIAVSLAAGVTIPYNVTDGIAATRTVTVEKVVLNGSVTDVGSGTGTVTYSYGYKTTVSISLKNMDSLEKINVILTDNLSALGGNVTYIDGPYESDGKAVWLFPDIEPGDSVEVRYYVDREISDSEARSMQAPEISSDQLKVVIDAQQKVDAGDEINVSLKTLEERPVRNATIHVFSPSGKEIIIVTDEKGEGKFKADEEGTYRYLVEGFQLTNFMETESVGASIPPTTASMEGSPSQSKQVMDFVPVATGIILVSLVIFVVMGYFSAKEKTLGHEEAEESEEAAVPREEIVEREIPEEIPPVIEVKEKKNREEEEPEEEESEVEEEEGEEEAEEGEPVQEKADQEYETAYDFSKLNPTERVKKAREITKKLVEMRRTERRVEVKRPKGKFNGEFKVSKKSGKSTEFGKRK